MRPRRRSLYLSELAARRNSARLWYACNVASCQALIARRLPLSRIAATARCRSSFWWRARSAPSTIVWKAWNTRTSCTAVIASVMWWLSCHEISSCLKARRRILLCTITRSAFSCSSCSAAVCSRRRRRSSKTAASSRSALCRKLLSRSLALTREPRRMRFDGEPGCASKDVLRERAGSPGEGRLGGGGGVSGFLLIGVLLVPKDVLRLAAEWLTWPPRRGLGVLASSAAGVLNRLLLLRGASSSAAGTFDCNEPNAGEFRRTLLLLRSLSAEGVGVARTSVLKAAGDERELWSRMRASSAVKARALRSRYIG